MFANQIDASGRSIQGAGVAEAPGEVAVDFTLKCIHKQVFKFNLYNMRDCFLVDSGAE